MEQKKRYSNQQSNSTFQPQTYRQSGFEQVNPGRTEMHSSSDPGNGNKTRNSIHKMQAGDTLWNIAEDKLGSGSRWTELQKKDGSAFTNQEARHLQIGTEVYLPEVKLTNVFQPTPTLQAQSGDLKTNPNATALEARKSGDHIVDALKANSNPFAQSKSTSFSDADLIKAVQSNPEGVSHSALAGGDRPIRFPGSKITPAAFYETSQGASPKFQEGVRYQNLANKTPLAQGNTQPRNASDDPHLLGLSDNEHPVQRIVGDAATGYLVGDFGKKAMNRGGVSNSIQAQLQYPPLPGSWEERERILGLTSQPSKDPDLQKRKGDATEKAWKDFYEKHSRVGRGGVVSQPTWREPATGKRMSFLDAPWRRPDFSITLTNGKSFREEIKATPTAAADKKAQKQLQRDRAAYQRGGLLGRGRTRDFKRGKFHKVDFAPREPRVGLPILGPGGNTALPDEVQKHVTIKPKTSAESTQSHTGKERLLTSPEKQSSPKRENGRLISHRDKPDKANPEKKRSINPADRSPRQAEGNRGARPLDESPAPRTKDKPSPISRPSTSATQPERPQSGQRGGTNTVTSTESRSERGRSPSSRTDSPGTQHQQQRSPGTRDASPTSQTSVEKPRVPGFEMGVKKFPKIPDGAKKGLQVTSRVAGKVAKPLAFALDTYEVGNAMYKDGGIGENTKKVAKDAAISWGSAGAGAATGAAIGSVVPVIGTAAGALVGGIVGGLAPDAVKHGPKLAKKAGSFVKGLFD